MAGFVPTPALLRIESTTAIFTKLVMSRRTKGSSDKAATATNTSTGREANPAA
jgi:hypothetical protein